MAFVISLELSMNGMLMLTSSKPYSPCSIPESVMIVFVLWQTRLAHFSVRRPVPV